MSFLDIVSKFNQQADSHSKSQSLNPFSEQFEQSRSPSPRFSREEYGKPIAGSKTDMRGRKAKSHICREILELCTVIHDVGTYNLKKRVPDDDDEQDDGTIIISFGELFQIYTKISDKVVGLLIAAKRRGFVYFDREILFQRRDDDVLIALLKPISEISKILKDDINQANAPAPVEPKPVEKKKSSSSNTKHTKSDCKNKQGENTMNNIMMDINQTNATLEVNGEKNNHQTNCNEEINKVDNGKSLMLNNIIEISETKEDVNCIQGDMLVEVSNNVTSDEFKAREVDNIRTEISDKTKNIEINETDKVEENNIEEIDKTKIEELGEFKIREIDEIKSENVQGKLDEIQSEKIEKIEMVIIDEIEIEKFNEIKTEELDETTIKKFDQIEKIEETKTNEIDETKTEIHNEITIEQSDKTSIEQFQETKIEEIEETKFKEFYETIEVDDELETEQIDRIKFEELDNFNKNETLGILDGNEEEVINVHSTDVSIPCEGLVENIIEVGISDDNIESNSNIIENINENQW